MQDMLFAAWFMVPAAAANMTPVFMSKAPGLRHWQAPLDFGKSYRGRRVFGPNKTWRGLLVGMGAATALLFLQHVLSMHHQDTLFVHNQLDYQHLGYWLLGPLIGLGTLGGDAIESFFKRQRGIMAGQKWLPFDQIDSIVGVIAVTAPFYRFSLVTYAWMIGIWFVAHISASYVGWLLHVKDAPV